MTPDVTIFDAIVVGSGISGGWAAKELCEKGLKTLVLERGLTVLLIEQNAKSALSVADQAMVLHLGKVVAEGRAHQLLNEEGLRHAYLGF